MISLEKIFKEMSEDWINEQTIIAERVYNGIDTPDLSRTEYVNSALRRAYASVQQQKAENNRQGAD